MESLLGIKLWKGNIANKIELSNTWKGSSVGIIIKIKAKSAKYNRYNIIISIIKKTEEFIEEFLTKKTYKGKE